jgi:tRNA modification GTPase
MTSHFDTIVAPITGQNRSAVAVIRVSGPEAWLVAAKVFPLPDRPRAKFAYYGEFAHGDDGYLVLFREGQSFTGEATAEMSIHGSPESVRGLLETCQVAGARAARPGEFTERAFLNGRIDLTQAEAIRETIEAQTEVQLRVAHRNRSGELRCKVDAIRAQALDVLADIEARVDFSEELGELDRPALAAQLKHAAEEIQKLLALADLARVVRNGLRIAIVGAPNVGKSSLFNAVVGSNRAIVTDIPGTTRDTIEATVEIGGQLVTLVDTAGIRETADPIEQMGVARSETEAGQADLVWYVVDANEPTGREFEDAVSVITVANKADLISRAVDGAILVSAKTGLGITELLSASVQSFDGLEESPMVNERHVPLLKESEEAIRQAEQAVLADIPADLAVTELRTAVHALGQMTGETATPDLLDEIFSRFCIGK